MDGTSAFQAVTGNKVLRISVKSE